VERIDAGADDRMPQSFDERRQLVGEACLARAIDAVDADQRDTILSCDHRDGGCDFAQDVVASRRSDHSLQLRTERLVLRRWRESDREPFARMNADPEVMRYLLRRLTHAESDAFVDRSDAEFDQRGYGRWAVEIPGEASFIGYVGLSLATFQPSPEIGWRLDRAFWGRGFATEAARAAIDDGFRRLGLREILSWTVPSNVASIRVMERVGMTRDPADDFEHPNIPEGHPLRHHVLYRISSKTGRLRAAPSGSSITSRAPSSESRSGPTRKRRA
jgi:ribosomal-protein-alanine N-acetyltransferase